MRRPSGQTAQVLQLFLDAPDRSRYGREIIVETGLESGSLYPMLRRLESRGILTSTWEDVEQARSERRRPRAMYRLTSEQRAREELRAHRRSTRPKPARAQRLRDNTSPA